MPKATFRPGNLVLYKNRPARILHVGDKIEIEQEGGKTLRVRPKDISLLHPGPLEGLETHLAADAVPVGEIETAWELLAGSTTSLAEVAELAYGEHSPATAWAVWQLVEDGLYFRGTPERIQVRSSEEVAQERTGREAKAAEEKAWKGFLERAQAGSILPEDTRYLGEVEGLALGQQNRSRVLRELGRIERPENAHALLLHLGHWDHSVNPYPQRFGLSTEPPSAELPEPPDEERVDLTHLPAFAIDDEGSRDPDDALSLEGDVLWVHIADAAAMVSPDSAADSEARARGTTLYLPEGPVPMLPRQAVQVLGLGLTPISPALSFRLELSSAGVIEAIEVVPSWVRVTRLTYEEVEGRLDEEPFHGLYNLARRYQSRRWERGAIEIELPEVKIWVQEGEVFIHPLPPLRSRGVVREAMLITGEAVARFALEQGFPCPFTTQDPPEAQEGSVGEGMAGMYALRRTMLPSQQSSLPGPHAGLGLDLYAQATSPLRRYLDLVVHQQLRAHVRGAPLLSTQEVLERVGAATAVSSSVRQAERLAERHWTMVYLQQHPDWRGEGVLVDRRDRRGTVLIPELDLITHLQLRRPLPLNSSIPLGLRGLNLAELDAHFYIVS